MKNISTFRAVAMGESHKAKNIPCQDAAGNYEDKEKGIYIAAISDGHGSERHFMSHHGSKILIDITIDTIKSFIDNVGYEIFSVEYSASATLGGKDNDSESEIAIGGKTREQDKMILNLISYIISNWNSEIEKHWNENIPSSEFMKEKNVPQDSIDEYSKGINLQYAYGCTLIAFARARECWFAFQIGDGACIAFLENAEVFYPIPADERFTGSTTASMCNSDALSNFRYCYGNTKTPHAVFVGSDGMDGVFGTIDEYAFPRLKQLYVNIIRLFIAKGYESTVQEIEKTLPELSAKGVTRDDMSLAGIIDFDKLKTSYPFFLQNEILRVKNEIEDAEKEYQDSVLKYQEKQKEIDNKISERETLDQDVKVLGESINVIMDKIKDLENSMNDLKKQIDLKTSQLKETDDFIKRLKDNVRVSKSNVDKGDETKQRLSKKLNELNAELNTVSGNQETAANLQDNKPDNTTEEPDSVRETDNNDNKGNKNLFDKFFRKNDN